MFVDDNTIDRIALHINNRINSPPLIDISSDKENSFTPQYFEITPFKEIDSRESRFYAIDGSYNSQDFYNGVSLALYGAGYACFHKGKEINFSKDVTSKSQKYFNENVLVTSDAHKEAIFDELLSLSPVEKLLEFFNSSIDDVFGWGLNIDSIREAITSSISKLLGFCQEILEWSLVYEVATSSEISKGDFILRDGTLRSNNIKQKHILKLARHVFDEGVFLVAVTKASPLKMELSSSFKHIDRFLETDLKTTYPFTEKDIRRQKLCCWFEVPEIALIQAYPSSEQKKKQAKGEIDKVSQSSMYAKQGLNAKGRGCGVFHATRLDYVEKLQNYDWTIVDLNVFDVMQTEQKVGQPFSTVARNLETISEIFSTLTCLTQEHYILGYPYPLVEIHNQISLRKEFKEQVIARLKASLYKNQRMDNIEIENLFLDIHDRF